MKITDLARASSNDEALGDSDEKMARAGFAEPATQQVAPGCRSQATMRV